MKLTVDNISSLVRDKDTYRFLGEVGNISLSYFGNKAFRFAWEFDDLNIRQDLIKASEFMYSAKQEAFEANIKETQESFELNTFNDIQINIEKQTGVISLYKANVLLHGGDIGSKDLVVPENPLRVIKNGTSFYGKFNFSIEAEDSFYGLGDKAGYPDRKNKRFQMFNRDALGYDAELSDPLYKSVPFFIRHIKKEDKYIGLFFPQPCIDAVDLGKESPYYLSVSSFEGPFVFFAILGESLEEIVANYTKLTGLPAMPPLYSFGYLGSSMNYLEPMDAEQRVLEFFEKTEKNDIPCEGMYFSSGYLKANDGKRYAFLWNKDKFSDYKSFLEKLKKRGYHIMFNIKPGILLTHPWYEDIAKKGYFIKGTDGKPYVEYYWGGGASFIDFYNKEAVKWWQSMLNKHYFDYGCDGVWNDNNELELEDSELLDYHKRAVYPVKMAAAAYDAFKYAEPDKRPWVYSRSGTSGLQRYSRTWTGDNCSDFKSLKFNQYMGLSLAMSGMPFYGHDIGGFFGNMPEEELLIRGSEAAVFQMRFVIHSWNEEGVPTEPWTYPDALPYIRSLIHKHYSFMPYIYSCAINTALSAEPAEKMLVHAFPNDKAISDKDLNSMFGPFVLKVPVTKAKQTHTSVYLPNGYSWYLPRENKYYNGGESIDIPTPMDGDAHYLIREGAILPVWDRPANLKNALWDEVTVQLFPSQKEESRFSLYEDDGETELQLGKYNRFDFVLSKDSIKINRAKYALPSSKPRKVRLKLYGGYVFADNKASEYIYDPDKTEGIELQITNT
ncbi:MAG: glycoside hydrolase family 31 protein [Eubacteriales bacterium]|nr:glycoside hydrolase family 31 protein [Eubacteriales bacterium]